MYAIIETGGKQFKVEQGDEIFGELVNAEADDVVGRKVMRGGGEDDIKVGSDVENAKVMAKVVKNGKAKKITVFTYKPKKSSSRKMGHRQPYTKLAITEIIA